MSSDRKLNWGLIGCGDIARKRVAPALCDLENSNLLAVNRANSELVDSFAKEFGAQRWYTSWRDLLADREIDAVYIATPVYLHAEQTIAAAEAGKHVLCEKPMAMNAPECDKMIAACAANDVKLSIAYYRHFYPVVERVAEILKSGEIGKPIVAQLNTFEHFDPGPEHPRRWLLEKAKSGGGPMFDFGCHRIEVLLHLFGPVKEVSGLTSKLLFDREVEDTATAMFQFERGPQATLTVTHAAAEPQDTLDIFGSEGSIHVPCLNDGRMNVKTSDADRTETHPPHPNFHQPLIVDFARAVLRNRDPKVTGEIGRDVATIEAAIQSLQVRH